MMEIVTENGKKKLVSEIEVVEQQEYDQVNDRYITQKYVKVHVVGKKFEWDEYYPYDIFKKLNPEVKV